jgi:hypothetical protein
MAATRSRFEPCAGPGECPVVVVKMPKAAAAPERATA